MRRTTRFLFLILAFALTPLSPSVSKIPFDEGIRLGISELSDDNLNNELVDSTVRWLEGQLGDRLSVYYFSVESLVDAVRDNLVDVTISSAGLYRASADYGAKDLLTSAFENGRDPNHCSAALFIVATDRKDITDLASLKGKRAVATRRLSITGLVMGLGEIEAQGYDSEKFFEAIDYTGYPMSAVVDRVADGKADVGMLWACYYEELQLRSYPNIERVRPFWLKEGDGLRCHHSTKTYPGHTVAVTPSASPEVARFISQTLLSMPKTERSGFFWTIGTDFHALDRLFRATKYGPYSYLKEWTVSRVWSEFRIPIALAASALFFWFFHTLRINALIQQRTKLLKNAVEAERQVQKESRKRGERIQALERLGAVQQMSSMLAHELKQPLSAIGYYIDSLIDRQEKKTLDEQTLIKTLRKVSDLNTQSSEVIDHVRQYAKKTNVKRERINVEKVVRAAVENVLGNQGVNTSIDMDIERGLFFKANRLEVELIVVNLLKNALEAVKSVASPRIVIQIKSINDDTRCGMCLSVSDNGPELSPEQFERLTQPFSTTRSDGLGLGIAIVLRMAESYGGRMQFRQMSPNGLLSEVFLYDDLGVTRNG